MIDTHTRRLVRGRLRLRGDAASEHADDKVIRVPLGLYGRTYAYLCRGARMGDLVEVDAALQGAVIVPVVGFGRDGYTGPLKRARVLR